MKGLPDVQQRTDHPDLRPSWDSIVAARQPARRISRAVFRPHRDHP
jgi:hypothetical protein